MTASPGAHPDPTSYDASFHDASWNKVLIVATNAREQEALLQSAMAIAHTPHGMIRLMTVTDTGEIPSWLNVPLTDGRVMIEPVARSGKNLGAAILSEIRDYGPDLLFIAWRGHRSRGRYQLGRVLDPVLQGAMCDIIVQQGQVNSPLQRVLIPSAGGPNAPRALLLARALAPQAQITALYIADQKLGSAEVLVGAGPPENDAQPNENGRARRAAPPRCASGKPRGWDFKGIYNGLRSGHPGGRA